MRIMPILGSAVLWSTLSTGCTKDGTGDAESASMVTHASGHEPGNTSSTSGAEITHSAMTLATTMMVEATTASTSGGCTSRRCDDLPTVNRCDVYAQDCPDGEKCAAVVTGANSWDDARCVPVSGTAMTGDPCTVESSADGLDSCASGNMCWNFNSDGKGICVALCTGSSEAPICDGGLECTISSSGVINLCVPTCDPLLQDCPHPGYACYPSADTFSCFWDTSEGEGKANAPCDLFIECEEGLLCGDPAFVGMGCKSVHGCCTPFCAFPDGPCPNPDQQCVQWFDPMSLPSPDLANVGACGVM